MLKALSPRGRHVTARCLILAPLALMLTACAAPQTPPAVACPEPTPLPAQLSEPLSPKAQSWSADVRAFLGQAETWLRELPQTETP